jgi:hypothetical protein
MAKSKAAAKKWINVPVHTDLKDRAQQLVDGPSNHGYNSVANLVNDALRRRLDDLDRRLNELGGDVERAAAKLKGLRPLPRGKFCAHCGVELKGAFCANCGTKA